MAKNEKALIAEYEWLRKLAQTLDSQINLVDARLIEIERQLPDSYAFPGDSILLGCIANRTRRPKKGPKSPSD